MLFLRTRDLTGRGLASLTAERDNSDAAANRILWAVEREFNCG